MSKQALFPGTFNPPTIGHLDIITRAAKVCDELVVGVAVNNGKPANLFTLAEREAMLTTLTQHMGNVRVVSFTGLVVDYAKAHGIQYLVRGLRAFSDFEHEFRMALANRKLSGIETVFLMSDQQSFHISSSLIREIGKLGHRLHGFVPDEIEDIVFQQLSKA